MKNIELIYMRNCEEFSYTLWDELIGLIPHNQHKKIIRFKFWKDRQYSLLGKLLLNSVLQDYFEKSTLADIKYTQHQKPYLEENFSFNISHSGNYIVFCYSLGNDPLGVDIEWIDSKLELENFDEILTKKEKKIIHQSANPVNTFYKIWTIKEAVLKADGRALSLPLEKVIINKDFTLLENKHWYCKQIFIENSYQCHLATAIKEFQINLKQLTIEDLLVKVLKKNVIEEIV